MAPCCDPCGRGLRWKRAHVDAARWPRLVSAALALGLAPLLLSACAFSSPVATQVKRLAGGPSSPLAIRQTLLVHLDSGRVHGVATRQGQVVRRNCSTTVIYAFNERVTTYLTQLHTARLRSVPLANGTPFEVRCDGALILELPASASDVRAGATPVGRRQSQALPTRSRLGSLPLAFGKRLAAEPGTKLALVAWPARLAAGAYHLRLTFELAAGPIREKAMLAASVGCGRAHYLQPILPAVGSMARLSFLTLEHSGSSELAIPRSSQREGSQSVQARLLSCPR